MSTSGSTPNGSPAPVPSAPNRGVPGPQAPGQIQTGHLDSATPAPVKNYRIRNS